MKERSLLYLILNLFMRNYTQFDTQVYIINLGQNGHIPLFSNILLFAKYLTIYHIFKLKFVKLKFVM